MTVQADQIRDRRRAFAAPGGSLDRMVRWLAVGLPAAVGVIAALMIVTPLSPRGEVSFLLDRNKVSVAEDRLRVDNAVYRGADAKGRPFSVSAGEAVQRTVTEPVVRMRDLIARILLSEGPAVLTADVGRYNYNTERVVVDSQVRLTAADGYRMTASGVAVDLKDKALVGSGGVEGAIPAGTFSANSLRADLDARTVTLDGNARLRMTPGKLQMPR
ncbi:LPS export ABC transporter periplasmic protein LptC [Altererythrobacter soli]|uniref:LPS export ABC transporter periplasmic protein LptC n=1 Tax=Croceibacterium soli TaxID=1739690 RepID=A0A6I4UN09_9SPHN|nr:LPS export ABC transporter periplasmic protein LptC [Croceibacterium soli]MXP40370.1 LPS export ABC transporter periplasmic protein LptC [Croceibacterium soli]